MIGTHRCVSAQLSGPYIRLIVEIYAGCSRGLVRDNESARLVAYRGSAAGHLAGQCAACIGLAGGRAQRAEARLSAAQVSETRRRTRAKCRPGGLGALAGDLR